MFIIHSSKIINKVLNYFPKYFTSKAINLYIISLVVVNIVFMNHALPIVWWFFGLVEVLSFFYFSNLLIRQWSTYSPKYFTKKLFNTALLIRVIWVIFSYFFYLFMTGKTFEFSPGDVLFYHEIGGLGADMISQGNFNFYPEFDRYAHGLGISDTGYPVYLSFIYVLTGKSILAVRFLKAIWSAWTCLLIFKIASRNFGDEVGRMAGIFAMLMPNLILYSGLHLKEVEMLFLTVLFIERSDFLIRSNKFTILTILPILGIGLSLFFFRTVLGITALFALFTTLFFSSKRVVSMNKRLVFITWLLVVLLYFVGGRISTEVEELWQAKNTNQETSLAWRAVRSGGNKFSTYASKSIFAPLILVIPFPTIVNISGQENQQLINGGNYVKNIMAFFVIFALVMLVTEKKWKDHLLILSFTIGYLLSIALSAFAQSERFHQPALPFLMILAAYGVSKVTNSTKGYYIWYLTVIFSAIVVWSWFKLAGRGMA